MAFRTSLVVILLGLSTLAQVAPVVTTLPATGVEATQATVHASFTVGSAQFLANPGLEDSLGPTNWDAANLVRLEGEPLPR